MAWQTPLHVPLAARGARHADDRGVLLPQAFGDDVAAEYAALRESAALLDLGFRVVVRATGADRVPYLQGMLTNDLSRLTPGQGCPALLLTIQGRVTADVRVAVLPEEVWLEVDHRVRDAFTEALGKLIVADDVELHEPAQPSTVIGLEGPRAAMLLGGTAVGALAPYEHTDIVLGDVPVRVQRASEVGGPGFVLHVTVSGAERVWDEIAGRGARPAGMEALEARRVECGVPRVGLDMDGSTLALEVPVEWAISPSKGCYLGQEVVARGTARGHVNRRLLGLWIEGPEPPRGAPLVRGAKECGRLTTVALSPVTGRLAALGFVRREHWEPGTELSVVHGHAVTLARVAELPLA